MCEISVVVLFVFLKPVYAALPGFSSVSMCWKSSAASSPKLSWRTYPDNVVWKTNDLIACPLGHLSKAFCFGLVFEGVAREIDA